MPIDRQKIQAQERNAGLLLIAAALMALVLANSGWKDAYDAVLHTKFGPAMPKFGVMDTAHWVSEALMAIFFLMVGLEVKREWYWGKLANPADRRLPIIAAIGGMAFPAFVYLAVVGWNPAHSQGWAIPAATDIAFAIGVLAILGRHAPSSIKLLLVSIAIVDDIGAVAIIAIAYTADLNVAAFGIAIGIMVGMATLNILGVRRLWPFLLAAPFLWYFVLASGVHATIAGVMTALTIPLGETEKASPLKKLENAIHPWVMFGIVPLFGFTSAGVVLTGGIGALGQPVALAVLLGLFIGKQIGVFATIWAAVKSGIAVLPSGARWPQIYGAAILTGIGFTMSLFIGALAFPGDAAAIDAAKIGTLAGSLLSAITGFAVFRLLPGTQSSVEDDDECDEIFSADHGTEQEAA
nr:Na+/H+ antiporter NhaA [uncultured Sphingomonas sp.]